MPQLNYLDDTPVADQDRRLAAAFMRVSELALPWPVMVCLLLDTHN